MQNYSITCTCMKNCIHRIKEKNRSNDLNNNVFNHSRSFSVAVKQVFCLITNLCSNLKKVNPIPPLISPLLQPVNIKNQTSCSPVIICCNYALQNLKFLPRAKTEIFAQISHWLVVCKVKLLVMCSFTWARNNMSDVLALHSLVLYL